MSNDTMNKVQDSYRQRLERDQSLIERQKYDVKAQAEKSVAFFLNNCGCDDIKLIKSEANVEYDGRFLNGSIKVVCSAYKGKAFNIEIAATVTEGVIKLPKFEEIQSLFPTIAAKSNSVVDSIANIPAASLTKDAEALAIEAQKEQFITVAEAKLINMLRPKYESIKIYKLSEADLKIDDTTNYNGQVNIFVELNDKYGNKKVKVPVIFKNSTVILPSVKILEAEIAKTITSAEVIEEETDKLTDEQIKKIEEEERVKEEETLKSLELGPAVASKKASTNNVNIINYAPRLVVNRSMFPDSIGIGSIINVDGVSYKVCGSDDATKLSEAGTGSTFTLIMLNENEKAEYNLGS